MAYFIIKELPILVYLALTVFISVITAIPHTVVKRQTPSDAFQGHQIFPEQDSPTVFPATDSPLVNPTKSPEYREFLTELYRFDKDKDPQTFQVKPERHTRNVRGILLRPLFVYQQESIKHKRDIKDHELFEVLQRPQSQVIYPYAYYNFYN